MTAPQLSTLNVDVTTTNGRFAQLQVEDALGNILIETEPLDGRNSGAVEVRAGQVYFFRLRAQDTQPAGFTVIIRLV